jgi:type 1 glutamine amidotransferase
MHRFEMRKDVADKKNVRTGFAPVRVLRIASCLSLCFLCMGCSGSSQTSKNDDSSARLLVFSKTTEFRHSSIKAGLEAMRTLSTEHRLVVDGTEDATTFTVENLKRYKAVIFLSTTGTVLDDEQKKAFEQYIRTGGGYVGIHSASDTEYNWAWYGQLVGAYFKGHPAQLQQASISIEDTQHISTSMLPHKWMRTDEWYNFRSNPRSQVHVLLTLSEATYQGGTMGSDHPISWYHDFAGGRSWYTGMGHTEASFHEPLFLAHVWGGITYAANLKEQS